MPGGPLSDRLDAGGQHRIGLGDQGGAYNQVFKDAFQQIVVENGDPATVLDSQATALQEVLDTAGAACWFPDPESDGTCQVGR